MKANETSFLNLLKQSPQFVVPIYQRTYSWTKRECEQLWNDILRTGKDDDIKAHFTGSIVYIQDGLYNVTNMSQLLVIDGQQRLTTIMLILEALARHIEGNEPKKAVKLRRYYLLNDLEDGESRFKLLLTETDKESLLALLEQKSLPDNHSYRIKENFRLFKNWVGKLDSTKISSLHKGLEKLTIVDISLDRSHDNPQLIFESMNSTGRDLSQADLIRNFVLMGLEPEKQKNLYKEHWRPMENTFGQKAINTNFDSYMRYYLTFRTGVLPRVKKVYEAFKDYANSFEKLKNDVDALVKDIHTYANYYCAMALDQEHDDKLAIVFRDLRGLKVNASFPFLLKLYGDYKNEHLSKEDFIKAVRLVEAYVFRRAVCEIPTTTMPKLFENIVRTLKENCDIQSIESLFFGLRTYRRFPRDDEFKNALRTRDLYNNPKRCKYLLHRLENYERKEPVPVHEYTIEHIMPQNENLSSQWRKALGEEWEMIQKDYLHTLGNLTLTGYNSEYSDHSFLEKRDMEGGFKESPLRLNKGIGKLDTWNEETIKQRAEELANKAMQVWRLPAGNVLDDNGTEGSNAIYENRSVEDYRFLATGSPTRLLFDEIQKAVLALDPGIDMVLLKTHVSFRAESSIVDVVAQMNRLQLYINLPFHELNDPRGITYDVTNVGHWGVGDVRVNLDDLDDIRYVMSLVSQAFENQISDGIIE